MNCQVVTILTQLVHFTSLTYYKYTMATDSESTLLFIQKKAYSHDLGQCFSAGGSQNH